MRLKLNLSTSIAIIGVLGASVGGLMGWGAGRVAWPSVEKLDQFTYPAGAISGFLASLFLSIRYSFLMSKRRRKHPQIISALFGFTTGLVPGLFTGIVYAWSEWNAALFVNRGMSDIFWLTEFIFIAAAGALIGGVTGIIVSVSIRPLLASAVVQHAGDGGKTIPLFSSRAALVNAVFSLAALAVELWAVITLNRTYSLPAFRLQSLNMVVLVFSTIAIILSILSLRERGWRDKQAFFSLALGITGLIGMIALQPYHVNGFLD